MNRIEKDGAVVRATCLVCDDGQMFLNDDGDLECPSCCRTWEFKLLEMK